MPPHQVRIEEATFDFAELDMWFRRLQGLFFRNDVVSKDIDEVNNRITVGVIEESAFAALKAAAASMGIPANAIEAVLEPVPGTRQLTLASRARPVDGGYQIDNINDQHGYCTFGFNTRWNNSRAFATASHCTRLFTAWI